MARDRSPYDQDQISGMLFIICVNLSVRAVGNYWNFWERWDVCKVGIDETMDVCCRAFMSLVGISHLQLVAGAATVSNIKIKFIN